MSDKDNPQNDAQGGGNSPVGGTGDQSQNKTFTQEQLDAILTDRLTRERAKFADYDDLKSSAAKWLEVQEAQKSDQQKLQDRLHALETERDKALARVQETMIRSAFVAAGAEANLVNPADAYRLADLDAVTIEDDGAVKGVKAIVDKLVEDGRLPIKGKPIAPSLNGSAGANQRPGAGQEALSVEELAQATKMGLTAEQYAKAKKKA